MNCSSVWLSFASDHPALAGHFPQRPIIPGVVLLDEALYAIEQAAIDHVPGPAGSHWHISSVKFHRVVQPNETLRLECVQQAGGALRLEMHVGQALALSAAIERRQPQL
jgi:3-hydroxymyristoyl/3-hydroxydecanoyl-(acyl carrier protein) dehydratase